MDFRLNHSHTALLGAARRVRFAAASVALAILAAANAPAADGDFVWARGMGGSSSGSSQGRGIATDTAGNVYTVGSFSNTVDFDPGSGTFSMTSAADEDIFIQKLDENGNFVWARAMGGVSTDQGNSIAVDATGNVYTTGRFVGTVDFDPGAGVLDLTSVSGYDIYVQKLDSSGNLVWARTMGGSNSEGGFSVAVDATGNVYTAGHFLGTVDFDPGPGTFDLTSTGSSDVFVQKLDADGELVWVRAAGGSDEDEALGLAVDASGNSMVTGFFRGTADFDSGPGTFSLSSAGANDVMVFKLNTSGNLDWARAMGGVGNDFGRAVAVDLAGNVYIVGNFVLTADLDPGSGTLNFSSAGFNDIFMQKFDTSGNLEWTRVIGSIGLDDPRAIAVDAFENSYITGFFSETVDFDPGSGVSNISNAGSLDGFALKLDPDGLLIGAGSFGGISSDVGNGIALDSAQNVHITGYFNSSADFDPGPGTFNLASTGGSDIFVLKLSGPPDLTPPNASAITPAESGPTNADSIAFDITFDEDVQGFNDAADLSVVHTGTAHTGLSVTGSGAAYTVTLSGISGDGSFTLAANTASDIEDLAGNPLASSVTSAPVAIDNTSPLISGLAAAPAAAASGEEVTITFDVSEALAGDPDVTVNGNPATRTAKSPVSYTYTYTVGPSDPVGPASIQIDALDPASNISSLSDTAALTITSLPPAVPVAAWPAAIALAAAALAALRRRALRGTAV